MRSVQMEAAFKSAEEKMVEEARKCVELERGRCEAELRREVGESAKKLGVDVAQDVFD